MVEKIDIKDPSSWIDKETFELYLGDPPSPKLAAFYDKAVTKKNMMTMSLNWLGLLLFPAWLGYRRQWTLLITVTLLFASTNVIEIMMNITIPNGAFLGC